MNRQVYVVAHSHWDAEWYFTCEDSHILLVENFDYLMTLLENDSSFESYTFDGLAIVLDDYIEIRPEHKEKLKKLINEKRIYVGPWYTQTDTLLVRTESVVRNLVYGIKLANEYGHSMNIGYLPDIFGQNAYLSSIFKSLGIDYAILQRGLYTEQVKDDLNFSWKSPNGISLPTNCLFYGYGPGKFLDSDKNYVENRLIPILDRLSDMNKNTNNILLPAGGDQVLANKVFPKTVEELNTMELGYEFKMSNYEQYMKDTWNNSNFTNVIEGELIACQKSRIHRTCHSTRYDMKQQTWRTEHLLLDHLEPLATIAQQLNIEYPKKFMDQLWKKVFASHAHNGIEASNADQVNSNVKNRLISVERSALSLINLLKKRIIKKISSNTGCENLLLVVNTNIHKDRDNVEVVLFTKSENFTLESINGEKQTFEIRKQEILKGGQKVIVTAQGEKLEKVDDYYRTEILLNVSELPSLGYNVYLINENSSIQNNRYIKSNETYIENEFYTLFAEDEHISLECKNRDIKIQDFMKFEDCTDYGDEFDFAPLINDRVIETYKFKNIKVKKSILSSKMFADISLKIGKDLESRINKVFDQELVVRCEFELRKGENLLRVKHYIENKMKDHRLRVKLSLPIEEIEHSYADQGYSIIKRDNNNKYLDKWKELGFVEKPMPIYTMENIVFLKDKENLYGVLTHGIKEYEVYQKTKELAITLYRSVGLLGRDNTAWRPGRASGINNKVVETPDAQMLMNLEYDYAICVDKYIGDKEIYKMIDLFNDKYLTYQMQNLNTFEERLERFTVPLSTEKAPSKYSLIEIDNENIFMSICKIGSNKNSMLIRLFNPTSIIQEVNIFSNNNIEIYSASMLEERLEKIDKKIYIEPKNYKTLEIEFKNKLL